MQVTSPTAAIIIFHQTPEDEQERIATEFQERGCDVYGFDVTDRGYGYARSLNAGIVQLMDLYDSLILANPDISLTGINNLTTPSEQYPIWGFRMHQQETMYVGGEIDRWRMSGGLREYDTSLSGHIPVDFVSGSLFGIKTWVFDRIGLMDESFHLYYEDVEFCHRARTFGINVGIDTQQWYYHFEQSVQKNPDKKQLLSRNRWRFFLKHATPLQKLREYLRLPKTYYEDGPALFQTIRDARRSQ